MEAIQDAKYKLYHGATTLIGKIAGTHQDSLFLEKGILTPEEFIIAGDHLVRTCGTWQ